MKGFWMLCAVLLLAGCGDGAPGLSGVTARHRLSVTAESAEPVLKILVHEGDRVAAGQPLMQLDPARATDQLAQAQAQLKQAQARLDELVAGPRRERIAAAQAALDQARSQQQRASKEFQRVSDLAGSDLVSANQLDSARDARDSANAMVRSRTADLQELLKGTRVEQLDQARAGVDAAQAGVDAAQLTLDRLTLKAPQAAQVEAVLAREGERRAAGAPLLTLSQTSPLFVRIYIPSEQRPSLHAGMHASVRLDGESQQRDGTLRYIADQASFTPYYSLTEQDRKRLTWLAEVDIEGDTSTLPAGIAATVVLNGERND